MKRDWRAAEQKRTNWCRMCAKVGRVELAHVIGRARDDRSGLVNPDSVVPLCQTCHREYDAGRLDLLPFLTVDEQVQAVRDAGGLEAARRRIIGSDAYRKEAA